MLFRMPLDRQSNQASIGSLRPSNWRTIARPASARSGLRELALDAAEGADILMVKPAITSLDVLARSRHRFDLPLAAYQVSGELAMLEAAAERGWLDRRAAGLELLTAIARAGADVIVTYLAADAAGWLAER
jgi:porphobilinogen synthase